MVGLRSLRSHSHKRCELSLLVSGRVGILHWRLWPIGMVQPQAKLASLETFAVGLKGAEV